MFEPLCLAFNRGCLDGHRPQIESFIATVDRSRQPALLARLLTIEVEYRRSIGEQPKAEEYLSRFPDHRTIVDALLLDTDHGLRLAESTTEYRPGLSVNLDPVPQRALLASMEVGRYRLIEKLGSGGAGEVWRALDPLLGRHVAIKILRSDRPQHQVWMQQLQAEARKMADLDLSSSGIVRVLDVGTGEGGFFIVSQLVEGGSLAQRLSGPPMSHQAVVELIAAAAEAIHQVHLKGLTHRDLKPANILLDAAGRPHIADFGLAVSEDDQLLEGASTVGTAAYMAPEQARGQSNRVDARTDVWALGVILYQLLCHRLPFKAANREALYQEILQREARPLRTIDDTIPAELERICLKCLSKPINERYTTSRDLALDLRRSLALVSPPISAAAYAAAKPPSRSIWPAATVTACAIVLIIAGWSLWPGLPNNSNGPLANHPGDIAGDRGQFTSRVQANSGPSMPADGGLSRQSSNAVYKPLIASLGSKDLTLQPLADRTGLRAVTNAAELISLGHIDAQDDVVEIALNQVPWTGEIGLFFGHGLGVVGDDEAHVFQAVILKDVGDGKWKLFRVRFSYSDASPGEWSSKNLASVGVEISREAKAAVMFRIRFDHDAVTEFAVDGVPKPELCDAPSTTETFKLASAGQLGLLLNHSTGVVSSLTINGTRQLFVPAD